MKLKRPWIVAAVALVVGIAVSIPFIGRAEFIPSLIATYVGAAIGFFIALYIDRVQRVEDADIQRQRDASAAEEQRRLNVVAADAQHERDAEIERRHQDREEVLAKERRVSVMRLLREELGPVPQQMVQRQGRAYPPSPNDRLSDTLWQAFSSSGELRWISDLDVLRKIASAYELVGIERELEAQWRRSQGDWGMAGPEPPSKHFGSHLQSLDTDTWTRVCGACKAIDAALIVYGAEPGANADSLVCP